MAKKKSSKQLPKLATGAGMYKRVVEIGSKI